jgi:hypothetical protein
MRPSLVTHIYNASYSSQGFVLFIDCCAIDIEEPLYDNGLYCVEECKALRAVVSAKVYLVFVLL